MPNKKCKHKWKEDELFKKGAVIMFFGGLDDLNRETRMICKLCGEIKYIKLKNGR